VIFQGCFGKLCRHQCCSSSRNFSIDPLIMCSKEDDWSLQAYPEYRLGMTGLWAECSGKNDRSSNTQPAIASVNKSYSVKFCVKNAVDWNNWRRLQRRSDKPHGASNCASRCSSCVNCCAKMRLNGVIEVDCSEVRPRRCVCNPPRAAVEQ
jgi:hypothetical protein